MKTTIHLERKQVPEHLRRGYVGHKLVAVLCEEITIPMTAGLWSGGSCEIYSVMELSTGRYVKPKWETSSPMNEARQDIRVSLERGYAVVRSTIFEGKNHGLTFYMRPEDAAPLLPKPDEPLTIKEKIVLVGSTAFKANYMGKTRAQMVQQETNGFPLDQWEEGKRLCIAKGLLNKAGAITVKGKNAARGLPTLWTLGKEWRAQIEKPACPDCHGFGDDEDTYAPCQTCGGTGHQPEEDQS